MYLYMYVFVYVPCHTGQCRSSAGAQQDVWLRAVGVVVVLADACLLAVSQRGSQVNATDSHKRTALHWACWYGHEPVVRVLLLAGADPTLAAMQGWTGLMEVSHVGDDIPLDPTTHTFPHTPTHTHTHSVLPWPATLSCPTSLHRFTQPDKPILTHPPTHPPPRPPSAATRRC
jgi:hypothetical protein